LLARDSKNIYLFKDNNLAVDLFNEYKEQYEDIREHGLSEWEIRVYEVGEGVRIEFYSPYIEYNKKKIYISVDSNDSIIKDSFLFENDEHWICANDKTVLYYNKETGFKNIIKPDILSESIGKEWSLKDMLYKQAYIDIDNDRCLLMFDYSDRPNIAIDLNAKEYIVRKNTTIVKDFIIFCNCINGHSVEDIFRQVKNNKLKNDGWVYNTEMGLHPISKTIVGEAPVSLGVEFYNDKGDKDLFWTIMSKPYLDNTGLLPNLVTYIESHRITGKKLYKSITRK
jgi:hypothetical protein